ncbi:glycosyl hydrolase family 28-related protein [Halorubrum sp. DTA46]|uniref:glycosyl hydrolase family 28-related protein n=1 Tax=Halorubrum sp. DTA46 TaxID=3402162 RepID=UPI003AAC27A7
MLTRRELLGATTISIGGLAGCSSLIDDDDDSSAADDEAPSDSTTVIDVTDFGVQADGVHDDTEALREALAAADQGDTVALPEGTMLVAADDRTHHEATAITVAGGTHPDDLTIRGAGEESVLLMDGGHESNHAPLNVRIGPGITGLLFENFTVDGNRSEQTQPDGEGGWNVSIHGADDDTVDADITLRDIWSRDANQTGFRVTYGGCVLDRCTALNSGLHGFGIDAWGDNRRMDPPIEVKRSYAAENGLYGIDCSGGRILVEQFVSEHNQQGTKTTEEVVETVYRRCRFKDNELLGYNRPTSPTETGQRAQVEFDDVISEGNGGRAFRFGFDTDYQVGTIIARGNNSTGETSAHIAVRDNASLDAEFVLSYEGFNSVGLRYGSSQPSTIHTYISYGNPLGALTLDTDGLDIANYFNGDDPEQFEDVVDRLAVSVPDTGDVGAGT